MRRDDSITFWSDVKSLDISSDMMAWAAKRPAHGVRDNRSPMQAPVGRTALGKVAPHNSAPVGRNRRRSYYLSYWRNRVL